MKERGSISILFALCVVGLLGFTGLVVDGGNMYLHKAQIQTALDAACLAGSLELPDTVRAYSAAVEIAVLNGLTESEITIAVTSNSVSATATKELQLFFMPVLGFDSASIGAGAAASGGTAPCFDYTLFSGSTSHTLNFNGNEIYVDGTAHTNANFRANGNYFTITGACEAVGTITTNGNHISIPYRYPHSSYVELPDYTAQVAEQAQTAGVVYQSSRTYNGNNIYVDSSIYINGNATLNGNTIYGAGAILATGNITINGNCISSTTEDQVCLYSSHDITINGNNIEIHGILYAPSGRITFNGNNITVQGKVIAHNVRFNGNDITISGSGVDVVSLPRKGARLIR